MRATWQGRTAEEAINDCPRAACVSRWSAEWWSRSGGQVPFNQRLKLDFGYSAAVGAAARGATGGVDARDGSGLQLSVVSESEYAVDDGKGCHGVLPDTVLELTSLPGEDSIEHSPRHCTSLAATVQQAQAWVVVARWDGTQIRSEKGRLHSERGKKSGPGRGRGKVARPGWGFLNDGLGWVGRPSSGFLGSLSFSLTVADRQTGRLPDKHGQAWTGPVRVLGRKAASSLPLLYTDEASSYS